MGCQLKNFKQGTSPLHGAGNVTYEHDVNKGQGE